MEALPIGELSLPELAALRVELKTQEEAAISARREVDRRLAELMILPGEGSSTTKVAGYKVSVTQRLNRSVDTKSLRAEWDALPAAVQSAFRWKAEVSVTRLNELANEQPAIAKEAGRFFTTKPGAPDVSVEAI